MRRRSLKKHKIVLIAIFFVAVIALYALKIPCVFNAFLGIPCPACGMTRAVFALFRFDVIAALEYHSLFWTLPMVFLYFLYDGDVFGRKWIDISVMSVIVAMFIVRWLFILTI